jgi:hypothetical protein
MSGQLPTPKGDGLPAYLIVRKGGSAFIPGPKTGVFPLRPLHDQTGRKPTALAVGGMPP